MIDPETGWDAATPLTITGILQDAAKPRPLQGTSLSLLMNDQEMADAGITPAGQTGQTGPMVAAADAFGLMCIAYEEPERQMEAATAEHGEGGWMG